MEVKVERQTSSGRPVVATLGPTTVPLPLWLLVAVVSGVAVLAASPLGPRNTGLCACVVGPKPADQHQFQFLVIHLEFHFYSAQFLNRSS